MMMTWTFPRQEATGTRAAGSHSRLASRRRASLVTYAKKKRKQEYGNGRARLPGLKDILPGMEWESSSAGKPSTSGSSAASGGGEEGLPSLGKYLQFGRMLGENPEQVQQKLALRGVAVSIDEESRQYLQAWEQEEEDVFSMFEAAVEAMSSQELPGNSAAARKLQRNKNVLAVKVSTKELPEQARVQFGQRVAMTAAEQRLTEHKQGLRSALGLGTSVGLVASTGAKQEAGRNFELVARRPSRPSSTTLAAKLMRPFDWQEDALPEEEIDVAWAGAEVWEDVHATPAAGGDLSPAGVAYEDFAALLGTTGGSKAARKKAKKSSSGSGSSPAFTSTTRGSLAGVERLKGAVPERPEAQAAQAPPAAAAGKVQLKLGQPPAWPGWPAPPARPAAVKAKPQASAVARETARCPLPELTLAAKPTKPAAVASLPAPSKPQAAPLLTAKPAAKPAVVVQEQPAELKATVKAVAPKPKPQPNTAAAAAAAATAPAPPAASTLALPQLPKTASAAPTEPGPQEEPAAVAPSPLPAKKLQRPQLQRPASVPATPQPQRTVEQIQAEKRARNAEYGAARLLDRAVETLKVWQVNSAGVLVRNQRLSGFVPLSLLAPGLVSQVLQEEQMLLAAVSAAAIVAQQEAGQAPGGELDSATRSAFRRQALAAVMMGRELMARVVNVDDQSGRLVLSEREAMKGRQLPTPQQLQAATALLGQSVEAKVVTVKPFGCFVEFNVGAPPASAAAAATAAAGGNDSQVAAAAVGEWTPLVGLVHRGEVSWDPTADITQLMQEGQRVMARVTHVDTAKGRVFLSIRRTQPNPLLDTLDSLVTSSAAARAVAAGVAPTGSGGGRSVADGGGRSAAPLLDQRPLLGDLPEAVRFCELLRGSPGVASAELGVRLQSRAASQELEVYLATMVDVSSISTAIVAAGSANSGVGVELPAQLSAAGPAACSYNLVLRKEQSVQEVLVVAALSRDEVRQLAVGSVGAVACEAMAAVVQQ